MILLLDWAYPMSAALDPCGLGIEAATDSDAALDHQ